MGRFLLFDWIFGSRKKSGGHAAVDGYGAPQATTMIPSTNKWFKNNTYVLQKQLRPQEKEHAYWDYDTLKEKDIQDVVTHCGCTAKVTWASKGISAEFTHTKGDVPVGGKVYDFFLTVYLNDGVTKKSDGRGNMVWPPEKKQQTLIIKATLMP